MQPLAPNDIKKLFIFILVLTFYLLWLVTCEFHEKKRKSQTISKHKARTGEPIAVDSLIHAWESDHQKLYQDEANKDGQLEWENLKYVNLNEYCRKYLYQCVPRRTTHNAIGSKHLNALCYSKENKKMATSIVIVTCKTEKSDFFHITRALEPNCVYALNQNGSHLQSQKSVYWIINKHCDFKQLDYIRGKKQKVMRTGEVSKLHKATGQTVAIDELLKQYELDHQQLLKIESAKLISWPQVTSHYNINEYCNKYVQKCVPNRNLRGIVGSWDIGTIQYYKENDSILSSAVVLACNHSKNKTVRIYYLTRAYQSNCVYALIRPNGKFKFSPFQIVNKHCDIEHTIIKLASTDDANFPNQNTSKKVKLEHSTAVDTLSLFPLNSTS